MLLEASIWIDRLHLRENKIKKCPECGVIKEILYRCKYRDLDWRFLCELGLKDIRGQYPESYAYGGTWKSKKK